ncbi:DNA polymerase III subunit delta' [Crocinitomicaceae bacterium]|nr:DNA polymerase III subunit delta' [Crocinitomicaceae bacterium]
MQFKNVIGQEELKSHLIQEIRNDKVSHAQLYLGKPGYGPLPMALAFVQYLFCENKQEKDSCGVCPSCKKITELQHPDLHFSFPVVQAIEKKSDYFLPQWREQIKESAYFDLNDWLNKIDEKGRKPIIGTDESQEIIKKLSLKSYEGGYKVMIIWMAEEMNANCSNKLLKILEEPPAKTLFLLVCESQEYLLQTILSRTQIVKIPRLRVDEISTHLKENFNLSSEAANSISARSEGDFIETLEVLSNSHEQDENRDLFIQLMRVCFKKNVLEMMDWAEKAAALSKEKQKIFLRYALHMFRQSIIKNYTDDQLTRVSDEEAQFLKNFSKFITGNNILDFSQTFNDAHYHVERNANSKILFTNICFKVMRYIHVA